MLASCVILAALCTLTIGKPVECNLRLHESRPTAPTGFSRVGSADAATVLNLRLGLVSSNVDKLIETLYDVSTPSSAKYGQHLSKSEAAAFLNPSDESLHAVHAWLADNKIDATTISHGGDWLAISLPVSQANEMLDADFSVYTHEESGTQIIRALQYSIPDDLVGHLQVVHPVTTFLVSPPKPIITSAGRIPVPPKQKRQSACDGEYIDPACLQELYGIPTAEATNPQPLLVTGYIEEYPSKSDTESFLSTYRPDYNPQASTLYSVVEIYGGSYDPTNPGLEANLDIQYTVGLATGVPVTFISVGDDANDDGAFGYLDTANYVLSDQSNAFVVTTSYGGDESSISSNVFEKLCNTFASLGTAGISVLFASGDGGVAGSRYSDSCTDFVPTFPSGCPYLTSVGATTGYDPETGASLSSGGFSNVFSTPTFQSSDVSAYLSWLGDEYSGLFNAQGRGYPDVSAQGMNVAIVLNGEIEPVQGTSCASPIFASVVALLNDELVSAGQSTLGFLNPWLYSNPDALNDITSGNNPGCGTDGFYATSGWSPITGLGTPNYDALRSAAGL
ncbi:hypothetical protein FOMPIDRAFT_1119585 [Fomitopsis schrenkii]|uniref:tripeptidyl-peptidase II n=1 Tax=Fomitopsis schrenkii TaxID=2126942 RepID=S8EF64_FOMSC|nr:hypothetical protein FOMPIDRAFT_1119585 [Fomitopsis schrenkii]